MRVLLFNFILIFLVSCSSQKDNLKKSPEQRKGELYYQYGTSDLMKRNYPSALKNLLKANELLKEDTKILNNLGMAFYLSGDKTNGIKYIKESLKIDRDNSDALNNIASIHLAGGNLNKAQTYYEKILKNLTYERQYRTHYNLGVIATRKGQTIKAQTHFNKSININESYCPSYYELGLLLRREGNLTKSLKTLKDGILGACYEQPATHYQIAVTLEIMGQRDEAIKKLNFIQSKFPKSKYFPIASQKLMDIESNRKSQVLNRKSDINLLDENQEIDNQQNIIKGPVF